MNIEYPLRTNRALNYRYIAAVGTNMSDIYLPVDSKVC